MSAFSTNKMREAAISALERFASENGFNFDDCPMKESVDNSNVYLLCTAPDGREFGISYRVTECESET